MEPSAVTHSIQVCLMDPVDRTAAGLMINLSASPFDYMMTEDRGENMLEV